MEYIRLNTYAKINLSLDVISRRDDGYHNIDSLMQAVDMCDEMIIAIGDMSPESVADFTCQEASIEDLTVRLYINSDTLPPAEDNLAYKGIRRYVEALNGLSLDGVVSVLIDKRLPVAAGIAGGSGNAAGAMLGLNALIGYPLTLDELMTAGCKAGADVPFSLMMNAAMNRNVLKELDGIEIAGTAAQVSGIGQYVEPVSPVTRYVIIANPGIGVSTREVYEAIDSLPEEQRQPKGLWNNIMERYTLEAYPEAKELKELLNSLNAEHVLMSGSGPTMVAYYTTAEAADTDFRMLTGGIGKDRTNWRFWLTETGKESNNDGFSVKGAETT